MDGTSVTCVGTSVSSSRLRIAGAGVGNSDRSGSGGGVDGRLLGRGTTLIVVGAAVNGLDPPSAVDVTGDSDGIAVAPSVSIGQSKYAGAKSA
jgi:hypothetical protein